jgi:hypothetical protein
VLFNFGGLARPSLASTYRLDLSNGTVTPFRQPKLAFDPSEIVTEQVFFRSKDGTCVPMFIAHRKGFRRDGSAPSYLYGYGAFGWVPMPWYQPHVLAWMEMGGVYAMVNTRGGGEYGEEWRVAGIGRKRQNAIDDYLGAAEYLIANGYTSAARLVANGGSASAPRAAAAIVQRPELVGASLLDIPVFDLIRFPLFTGGNRWIPDFGSPDDRGLRSPAAVLAVPQCRPALSPDRAGLSRRERRDRGTVPRLQVRGPRAGRPDLRPPGAVVRGPRSRPRLRSERERVLARAGAATGVHVEGGEWGQGGRCGVPAMG